MPQPNLQSRFLTSRVLSFVAVLALAGAVACSVENGSESLAQSDQAVGTSGALGQACPVGEYYTAAKICALSNGQCCTVGPQCGSGNCVAGTCVACATVGSTTGCVKGNVCSARHACIAPQALGSDCSSDGTTAGNPVDAL